MALKYPWANSLLVYPCLIVKGSLLMDHVESLRQIGIRRLVWLQKNNVRVARTQRDLKSEHDQNLVAKQTQTHTILDRKRLANRTRVRG